MSGDYYHSSTYSPVRAFDGIKDGTDDSKRWLGKINTTDESKSACIQIDLPNEIPYCVPVSYKIWRLSTALDILNRAPTAWNLYGVTTEGERKLISQVTSGISWSETTDGVGEAHEVSSLDIQEGDKFVSLIWIPRASRFTDNNSSAEWNVGIMELEITIQDIDTSIVYIEAAVVPGTGTIKVEGEKESDQYSAGKDTLKITATSANDKQFVRWIGEAVPEGMETQNPLEFTVQNGGKIVPVFEGMWTLDRNESKISDTVGNWVLNVFGLNTTTFKMKVGASSNSYGCAYANGTGNGELDLSTPIVDTLGNQWVVSTFAQFAFRLKEGETARITSLILPKEFEYFSGQSFHSMGSALTNIVMECPILSGAVNTWSFESNGSVKRFVMKCPKVSKISSTTFSFGDLSHTDLDTDWDLSGLKNFVKDTGNTDRWGFRGKKFKGTLRLPVIETIDARMFQSTSKLNAIVLGEKGNTVKKLGAFVFGGTCSITNAKICASADGWTIGTNAFTLANGLSEIVIIGPPPTVDAPDGGSIFGNTDAAEKICCIYVPGTVTWRNVFAALGVEKLSAEELTAFKAARPNAVDAYGILPAGAFGNKYPQYVGFATHEQGVGEYAVSHSVIDPRYGDTITSVPENLGNLVPGAEVTLKANLVDGAYVVEWTGLPPNAILSDDKTEVSFTVDLQDIAVGLRTTHTWTLLRNLGANSATNMITDGVWKLYVCNLKESETENTLYIGKKQWWDVFGAFCEGSGILDLDGPVVDEEEKPWKIVGFGSACFQTIKEEGRNEQLITMLIMPKTTRDIGSQFLNKNASEASTLTNIVADLPEFKGKLPDFMFAQQAVRKAVIKAPYATGIDKYMINGNPLTETDFSSWQLDRVENIKGELFLWKGNGSFKLPSLLSAGTNTFYNAYFNKIELGTMYKLKDQKSLSLDTNAIRDCEKLKTLIFGPYKEITTEEGLSFVNVPALTSITFTGRPPARETLDDILDSLPAITNRADGAAQTIIYGSRNLGWDDVASVPTPEEEAFAPTVEKPEDLLGVYESADKLRRAWIIHKTSEFDPKGTVIIIR